MVQNRMVLDPPDPPQRSFEIIARQIAAMVRTRYNIGQKLPGERELAKSFGVSRPTIREAILSLAMAGMVRVRNNSGAYVVSRHEAPEVDRLEGFGPFENLRARHLIEPQIAGIAAQHASEATIAKLAESLAAMRWEHSQGREADQADHRFHILLAEASGNGVLVSICDQLWRGQIESRIWREIHTRMRMEDYRLIWLQDHEKIYAAVVEHNPRRSSAAMAQHLTHIEEALMTASHSKVLARKARTGEGAGP
jgi:GntR family transcriptional regulator, uxu operon transcriptional repressor